MATADSLARQGRHEAAADLYQQLAQQTEGSERQRYLMLTARQRLLAGTPDVARAIVQRLDQPVDESNQLLWAQVSAEVAIAMGNPASALATLDAAPEAETATDATNILLIRSQALFRLGQPVAATMALLEREIWLDQRADIAANQRILWDGYRIWGVESLAGDATPTADPTMRGWLALGEIAWNRRTSPTSMRRALIAWQDEFPEPSRRTSPGSRNRRRPAVSRGFSAAGCTTAAVDGPSTAACAGCARRFPGRSFRCRQSNTAPEDSRL